MLEDNNWLTICIGDFELLNEIKEENWSLFCKHLGGKEFFSPSLRSYDMRVPVKEKRVQTRSVLGDNGDFEQQSLVKIKVFFPQFG